MLLSSDHVLQEFFKKLLVLLLLITICNLQCYNVICLFIYELTHMYVCVRITLLCWTFIIYQLSLLSLINVSSSVLSTFSLFFFDSDAKMRDKQTSFFGWAKNTKNHSKKSFFQNLQNLFTIDTKIVVRF